MDDSGKEELKDKKFSESIDGEEHSNKLFVRLVAKSIKFTNINFKYCTFDACYLRDSVFDSCDFTGCRFINTNLVGSSFSGCKFDYATFDKTFVDTDILDNSCPSWENLKLTFARTLRVNYQQLGDAISANKAIQIELKATEEHLHKAWNSNESYYRKKYGGWKRTREFFRWANFKLLDILWGNGESPWKLCRTILFTLGLIASLHVFIDGNINQISDYLDAMLLSPQILLGVTVPEYYQPPILAAIYLTRLVLFSFFMSIIIKRFNRR